MPVPYQWPGSPRPAVPPSPGRPPSFPANDPAPPWTRPGGPFRRRPRIGRGGGIPGILLGVGLGVIGWYFGDDYIPGQEASVDWTGWTLRCAGTPLVGCTNIYQTYAYRSAIVDGGQGCNVSTCRVRNTSNTPGTALPEVTPATVVVMYGPHSAFTNPPPYAMQYEKVWVRNGAPAPTIHPERPPFIIPGTPGVAPNVFPEAVPPGQPGEFPTPRPYPTPMPSPLPGADPSTQPEVTPAPVTVPNPRPITPSPGVVVHPPTGPGEGPTIVVVAPPGTPSGGPGNPGPQPVPGGGPAPSPAPGTGSNPGHSSDPAPPGTVEQKFRGPLALQLARHAMNAATEGQDLIEALWLALYGVAWMTKVKGKKTTLAQMLADIQRAVERGQLNAQFVLAAIQNLAANELVDYAGGRVGRRIARLSRASRPHGQLPVGLQLGPAL